MPVSVMCDSAAVTAAIRDSIASSTTNGSCAGANDDSQTLQSKLVASAKRVLLTKIEYEEVNSYSQSVLDTFKSKYIVLKPSSSAKLNHNETNNKDANQNQCNATTNAGARDPNQLPQPKKVLYPRQNVQIGWKGSGRKWQVGAGMINVGNTCYLNSTLQALFHVPAMANWLMSDSSHREKCEDENGSQNGCIICAMSKTLISSQSSQNPIRPYLVYTKLRMVCKHLIMGRQEDAHEFLRYLVEAMEKSYLARFRNSKELEQYSKETTPLNQILGGYLKSAVRCLACGHVSTTFQHFQDILLDIRKANSIEEALDGYFARERLEDMGYKCEACKKKVSATKQFSLERAPISLCIQLKRFSMMGSKLNKHVAIRPRLDLSPYASKTNKENLSYKLVAMVTHLGASQHCGHYTAIGLTDTGTYYQFDDSYVRPISLQNVVNTNAYIIFYELDEHHDQNRQTSTQVSREHTENGFKDSGNKLNSQSSGNENSLQRQNSSSSTSNGNEVNFNSKLISKLDANHQNSLIGPQLPSKTIQRNPPASTSANSNDTSFKSLGPTTSSEKDMKDMSKLVNSESRFNNLSDKIVMVGFHPSLTGKETNIFPSTKQVLLLKNNASSTNNKSDNSTMPRSASNDESKKTANRPELSRESSFEKDGVNNNNRSKPTLPSMPKLEESSSKSGGLSNGNRCSPVVASKSNTMNGVSKSQNLFQKPNIKSLVPYESDEESDQSVDDALNHKNCQRPTPDKSVQKRPYDSDNESSSSASSSRNNNNNNCRPPPPPKISLTPPSTPIIRTKSGLWQVTDIGESKRKQHGNNNNNNMNGSSINGERKNPFASATPTTYSPAYTKSSDKYSGRDRDRRFSSGNNNKKNNEMISDNGKNHNGTVEQLLKFSHRGYGAPVLTWNGQKPTIEKEVIEEIRQERKREFQDDDDNEMDRGRQKKMKSNNGYMSRDNSGYNPFQEYQNHQSSQHRRWNNTPYRPYRPNNNNNNNNNHHRNNNNNNNNNFRRRNFHKRMHHQRNGGGGGGGNGYHHRRDS